MEHRARGMVLGVFIWETKEFTYRPNVNVHRLMKMAFNHLVCVLIGHKFEDILEHGNSTVALDNNIS